MLFLTQRDNPLRNNKWFIIFGDNLELNWADKNIGIFAKQVVKLGVPTLFLTNETDQNREMNSIDGVVQVIKIQKSTTGGWGALKTQNCLIFLIRNVSNVRYVWIYRDRRYSWCIALLAKAIGARVIVKLDSMGGVSALGDWIIKKVESKQNNSKASDLTQISNTEQKITYGEARQISSSVIKRLARMFYWTPRILKRFLEIDLSIAIADAVLCETLALQEQMRYLNLWGHSFLYPNVVVLSEMKKLEMQLVAREVVKENMILCVGRIVPTKGFEKAIQIFADVPRETRNLWHMQIIGPIQDYEYYESILRLIQDLGLDGQVSVISGLYKNDLFEVYFRSKIFLMAYPGFGNPKGVEGQPNVVVEAMFFHNAVVTSDVGTVDFLVDDGETGFLFPPDDLQRASELITWLMQHEASRERYAKAGRIKVESALSFEQHAVPVIDTVFCSKGAIA